jgi:hypothetical protein
MMRQYRAERFLRDHADDDARRQAPADGMPAAIAAAIIRIREEETLAQLREVLRP